MRKEKEIVYQYEEQIQDIRDKLERKEYFMQNKEKKWLEIEKILHEYLEEDDELMSEVKKIKFMVDPNKKITNVIEENNQLKVELEDAYEEINRLRSQFLSLGIDIKVKEPPK